MCIKHADDVMHYNEAGSFPIQSSLIGYHVIVLLQKPISEQKRPIIIDKFGTVYMSDL